MTSLAEQVWLMCQDPRRLLEQAQGWLGERKLRLLVCACYRRDGLLMTDGRKVQAVEAMEEFVDRRIPKRDLKRACKAAGLSWQESFQEALRTVARLHRCLPVGRESVLCDLVREVAGNPFRRAEVRYSWLRWNNGTPLAIARAIYEERRFEDLPILADALEDAGCTSAPLLCHCRSVSEHVRGCWVLDALLGQA
jgi:hypothetical protein